MSAYGQGFYPGQQGPPPPGFQPGYPPPGGYPSQGFGGYPPQQPGYPPQAGYPQPGVYPGGYPQTGYTGGGGGMPYSGYGEDPLNPSDQFAFSEKSIRHGFIRKVYGILFCQLLVTFGMVCLFSLHEPTKRYVSTHGGLWWIALGVMLICLIVMACCGDVRRKAPMNFIFLGIFTAAQGFMLGCASVTFNVQAVMMAIGITLVVVFALTVFAFQTKIDFTMMGGVLMVCCLVLMLFGLCLALFGTNNIMYTVYASLGALLFSIYIIYDTQLMMGGNHKFSISPEEYIFAALNLYLDVINLFMYILILVGGSRD